MEEVRFERFLADISGIYRELQKLKTWFANGSEVKAVHIFWLYLLRAHPAGLTASQLAAFSQTTASLVSREVSALIDNGLLAAAIRTNRRRYGEKLFLTARGRQVAEEIGETGLRVQHAVSGGISDEELTVFYRVLEQLSHNFAKLNKEDILTTGEHK